MGFESRASSYQHGRWDSIGVNMPGEFDLGFGDLATSQDFGAYFQPQSIPAAMPSFTPETSWTAPPGSVKDTGMLTDFAGAAKSALPWLQLGTTALGAVSGGQAASAAGRQAKTAEKAQKVQAESARQAQATAGPAAAFGERELGRAEAGQLDPAIEAGIAQWVQAAKQQIQQWAASHGQGDSTWLRSKLEQLDQMAVAMRGEMLQQEQQLGLQGIQ